METDSRSLAKFVPALILLAISYLINYVDRGNISVAGPLLRQELNLTPSKLGVLFAAFFCTYTAMQFVIGWLVDRFDANIILAAGFLVWSLATTATGFVHGYTLLLGIRFVLGIGESVALPCGSKILGQNLPEHHRGFASGTLMSALRCGNAVGTLVAGILMSKYGWRPVFVWIGLASLLWLPAWSKWMPRRHRVSRHPLTARPTFSDILSHRSFWGTCIGHFASNYLLYFMITWLPSYLVLGRGLSMTAMAVIAGLCYSVDAASAIFTGWLQDLFIRKGYPPTLVRKSAMAAAFSIAAIAIIGASLAGQGSFVKWLTLAAWGCGMTSPGLFTFPQTLAGPHSVGKWYGWQNGFANFAGIVGPALTGVVLQKTGSFVSPFAITAGVCVVGLIAWVFVVGRVERVHWAAGFDHAIIPSVPGSAV